MGRWLEELFPKEQGKRQSDSCWSREHLEMSYTSPGGWSLGNTGLQRPPKGVQAHSGRALRWQGNGITRVCKIRYKLLQGLSHGNLMSLPLASELHLTFPLINQKRNCLFPLSNCELGTQGIGLSLCEMVRRTTGLILSLKFS